jgi:hypothetical protein
LMPEIDSALRTPLAGLDPATHALASGKTWTAGTSPAEGLQGVVISQRAEED